VRFAGHVLFGHFTNLLSIDISTKPRRNHTKQKDADSQALVLVIIQSRI
jgi:hypothetical protein